MATPSHRLKLYRAEEHLDNLKRLLTPVQGRRPHPVRESLETHDGQQLYTYRLELGFEVPEHAYVLTGDFLFNARSALDHMAVAFAPIDRKRKAAFPILVEDPLELNQTTGGYLHRQAHQEWIRMTKGMSDPVVTALTSLQPYVHVWEEPTENVDDHALAILGSLQNADKHRELVIFVSGISQTAITANGNTIHIVPLVADGTAVHFSATKVDVQVVGASHIAVGVAEEGTRKFPSAFDTIMNFIANWVLPPLEPLLPSSERP